MTSNYLSVGDRVLWRGSWGTDAPRLATVLRIESTHTTRTKHGRQAHHLDWDRVRAGYAVVDLDTGNWAYGDQISPLDRPLVLPEA
jgi:hypothetical protein